MRRLICMCAVLCLLIRLSVAQSYRYRADLQPVRQSGFHRIMLPPAVVGQLNNTLGDIRLVDKQGREVPYRLRQSGVGPASRFVAYPIISRNSVPDRHTTLVVQPPNRKPIQSLTLLVKNARLQKQARLSGSNDNRQWFGLRENIVLESPDSKDHTSGHLQLDFPLSDYRFYRLDLADSLTAPLNILQIGGYQPVVVTPSYTPIKGLRQQQLAVKTTTHTDIRLTFPAPARIDRLVIPIDRPARFERRAELGLISRRRGRRRRVETEFEVLRSFTLRSGDSAVVLLSGLRTPSLHLIIHNGDSPPLQPGRIRAYQRTTWLTADLNAGTPYALLLGNEQLSAPQYDLTAFSNPLPDALPIINLAPLSPTNTDTISDAGSIDNRWFIWPALGLALLIMAIQSYRLIKEMQRPVS
ncbi:hypothetical protein GGR92_002664 [Spirosoma lacussanchae]|uniref:DUF3999 family protein n=1 Tax=Spirosoma lacussanchae TaxID=1884249 RepID=UPI00110911AB|nr:DUF3999 family protein [Spirosoma lacussanchae]